MSWAQYLSNPRAQYFKKAMFEVLQHKYHTNEPIVERLSVALQTEGDMTGFMTLVGDIYEAAYLKAVNDHKEQLQKAGLIARVVPEKRP